MYIKPEMHFGVYNFQQNILEMYFIKEKKRKKKQNQPT